MTSGYHKDKMPCISYYLLFFSMGIRQHEHSPSVIFYPLGLSNIKTKMRNGWQTDTYSGFLKRFKEENVSCMSLVKPFVYYSTIYNRHQLETSKQEFLISVI